MSGYEPIQGKPVSQITWTKLPTGFFQDTPGDLHFYKCVEVNNHLLLIGGISEEYPESRGYDIIPTLSVSKVNPLGSSWRWNFRKASGDIPPVRYGHTVTRVDNKAFLFGGRNPTTDVAFNDFYYLDLDILRWRKIEASKGNPPSPRYDHTCTFVESSLFIIGGITQIQTPMDFLGDVHVFDLEGWKWEENDAKNSEGASSSQGSNRQFAIAGHIAVPHVYQGNSEILVFGGSSQVVDFGNPKGTHPNHAFNRFYRFKIASRTWEKVNAQIPVNQRVTQVVQGESSSTFDSMVHHAATWRQTYRGLEILIHGGYVDGSGHNEIRVLQISDDGHFKWIFPPNTYYVIFDTPELRHHNMVVIEDELYLLGGMKDLGKQSFPFLCLFCLPNFDILNYTSIFKVTLPLAF